MAREPLEILKGQLGNLLAEVAFLTSLVEQRDEEIAKLKADEKPIKKEK